MELNTETIGRSPIFLPGKPVLLFVDHEVLRKRKRQRTFSFFQKYTTINTHFPPCKKDKWAPSVHLHYLT